jgi:hypothetical protein
VLSGLYALEGDPRGEIMTVMECHQQADEETLRSVFEYQKSEGFQSRCEPEVEELTHELTHGRK